MRLLTLTIFAASLSQAALLTFEVNTTLDGQPVHATVVFNLTADNILITATNLVDDPISVNSVLTSIEFVLSGAAYSADFFTSSAIQRTIAKAGTFADSGALPTDWVYSRALSTIFLTWNGGSGPDHGVIGGPNGKSGNYDAAKGSIAGNGPHNPFLAITADFNVALKGVTGSQGISDVKLGFNTTGTDIFTAVCTTPGGCGPTPPIPEPSTYALMGAGLLALLAARRARA
jgi:hypothetical protein